MSECFDHYRWSIDNDHENKNEVRMVRPCVLNGKVINDGIEIRIRDHANGCLVEIRVPFDEISTEQAHLFAESIKYSIDKFGPKGR